MRITIAFLTRNAGELLARSLAAIREQSTAHEVELLAVDSGSTDDTVSTLLHAGARVVEIPHEEFNFGRTRDFAYQRAKGEIVVNLSQDAVPAHRDWLEKLLAPLEEKTIAASCGRSVFDPERGHRQFAWERNGYFYFTREMARFRQRYGRGLSFSNSAVRRSVWEQLRFGPIALGEDFQFQIAAKEAGFAFAFPEGADVLHHHDYTLPALWRRCRDEGAALKQLGCPYSTLDLARDLSSLPKFVQFARDIAHVRLRTPAEFLFPLLRPFAVYSGNGAANPESLG